MHQRHSLSVMNLAADAYLAERERVAANVRAEVARRGIAQSALAEALHMNQAGISRRLNGRIDFSASELSTLGQVLSVPVAVFFGETALTEGGDAA